MCNAASAPPNKPDFADERTLSWPEPGQTPPFCGPKPAFQARFGRKSPGI